MGFDPGMAMAALSAITNLMGQSQGNDAQQQSSFSKPQQGGINDILNSIKGMKGNMDITQNQGYKNGQNWLHDLFNDQNFFDKFEAPMQRNFEENTIPELANRFGGMGSGGSFGTSFRNQANREGERLQESMAALRGGMQQQGVNQGLQYAQQPFQNMMQMYNQALGQPMMNQYQPATTGGWGSLSAPFAQGATSYWGGQGGMNNNQNNNQGYNQGMNNNQSYANGGSNQAYMPPQMTRQYPGQ